MGELPTPQRLSDQRWPAGSVPVVTICCATYNHAGFIAAAVDGFLSQETTFPVEIIIHDDASSDGTAEIVRGYQEKFPDLIRPILQTQNQYSLGIRCPALLREMARGTLLATCEGDDYWTDPRKLQHQVDYLRAHPDVVLTFHDVAGVAHDGRVINESQIAGSGRVNQPRELKSFAQIRRAFIPTLSIVFRKLPLPPPPEVLVTGDLFLFAMLSRHGEMHQVGGCMGAYRQHPGGVWSARSVDGRRDELVKTTRAIMHSIHPDAVLEASLGLAFASWRAFWSSLSASDFPQSKRYLREYLRALAGTFRHPWRSPARLLEMLRYQAVILLIPPRNLVLALLDRRRG